MRQPQLLLGAGDADVEQAAFLVEAAFLQRHLVRQRAVLAADDEDVAELQPLGAVHRHQPHLVAGVALVGVREQCELRGEFAGARALAAVEPAGEFLEVFLAALEAGLVLALRADRREHPRLLAEHAHQFRRAQPLRVGAQRAHDADEAVERVGRARRELLERADRFGRARHRHVRAVREFGQLRQRGRADFALGRLHRAQERGVVVGIGDQAQPGQRVLHFLAFQERGAAADRW